jgi:hypothetical protein
MAELRRVSFIVRVVQDGKGETSGIIEQVATGKKEPFAAVEAIGQVILGMLQREAPHGERTAPERRT